MQLLASKQAMMETSVIIIQFSQKWEGKMSCMVDQSHSASWKGQAVKKDKCICGPVKTQAKETFHTSTRGLSGVGCWLFAKNID